MEQHLTTLLQSHPLGRRLAEHGVASYVAGHYQPGNGARIVVENPANGQELLTYQDFGTDGIDAMVAAASQAQRGWAALTADKRARLLARAGLEIEAALKWLAAVESLTAGRPIKDCLAQVERVSDMFAYYAGWADKLYGEVIPVPNGLLNYVVREPVGVLLHIVPWNSPLFMAAWHVAPSLAAGNAVLLKPSELTPVTALLLAQLIEHAGVPKGLVNVIAGYGHTSGTAAIAHRDVHKVGFVGSPATGQKVAMQSAAHFKPCVLELGGKSANIVFADADLEAVVQATVKGIFIGAGQTCVAASRLVVHRSVQDTLVDMLMAAAAKLRVGNPADPTTDVGPIHNRRQLAHVHQMIQGAQDAGAEAVACATALPEEGFFVAPVAFKNVHQDAEIAQTEVFGPVLSAIPFDTENEAVAIANGTPFALAGAVWTRDVGRAHRVAAAINAGSVWINTYKATDIRSPFGGNGMSGHGRSSGKEALHEYTRIKSVWVAG